LAEQNVSEMTYLVLGETQNLNSISQLEIGQHLAHLKARWLVVSLTLVGLDTLLRKVEELVCVTGRKSC